MSRIVNHLNLGVDCASCQELLPTVDDKDFVQSMVKV